MTNDPLVAAARFQSLVGAMRTVGVEMFAAGLWGFNPS